MSGLSASVLAAGAIFVMMAVTVLMDWVPTPLNRNIREMTASERLPSTIIHTGLGLLFIAANIFQVKWGMFVGALWYAVVLFAAIRNWWIPYFFGIHKGEINPDIFSRHYARNASVLPPFRGNPVVPDLQHMLIHATLLCAALLSLVAFWQAS